MDGILYLYSMHLFVCSYCLYVNHFQSFAAILFFNGNSLVGDSTVKGPEFFIISG